MIVRTYALLHRGLPPLTLRFTEPTEAARHGSVDKLTPFSTQKNTARRGDASAAAGSTRTAPGDGDGAQGTPGAAASRASSSGTSSDGLCRRALSGASGRRGAPGWPTGLPAQELTRLTRAAAHRRIDAGDDVERDAAGRELLGLLAEADRRRRS